jgi:hypothetical protein
MHFIEIKELIIIIYPYKLQKNTFLTKD